MRDEVWCHVPALVNVCPCCKNIGSVRSACSIMLRLLCIGSVRTANNTPLFSGKTIGQEKYKTRFNYGVGNEYIELYSV